jgi:hypothetical protein
MPGHPVYPGAHTPCAESRGLERSARLWRARVDDLMRRSLHFSPHRLINSFHQIIPSIRPSIDAAVGKLQYATGTKGELDEVIVGIDAFARRQHGVS